MDLWLARLHNGRRNLFRTLLSPVNRVPPAPRAGPSPEGTDRHGPLPCPRSRPRRRRLSAWRSADRPPPEPTWSRWGRRALLVLRPALHRLRLPDRRCRRHRRRPPARLRALRRLGVGPGRRASQFRASGRFADTPADAGPAFAAARLHTGLLEARLGSRLARGRRPPVPAVRGGRPDPGRLRARWHGAAGTEVTAWGGAAVPFRHAFDVADFDRDAAAGAQVSLRPGRGQRLAAVRRLPRALRPRGRPPGGPGVHHHRRAPPARPGPGRLRPGGRALAKLELQGQWRPAAGRPVATLQFVDRRPSIDAASWFSRFTGLKRIRLARAVGALDERRALGRRAGVRGLVRGRAHQFADRPGGAAARGADRLLPAHRRRRRREQRLRRGGLAGPALAAPGGRGLVPDLRPVRRRSPRTRSAT